MVVDRPVRSRASLAISAWKAPTPGGPLPPSGATRRRQGRLGQAEPKLRAALVGAERSQGHALVRALNELGLDTNSTKQPDLDKAADLDGKIRGNVRKFHSSEYLSPLATG